MRFAVLGILILVALSCRDIEPVTPPTSISGYQLNGILTTTDGAPVQGATVRVYYYYDQLPTGPVDTVQVVVTDSTKAVDISVYTTSYIFLRTLFFGYRRPGPVPRFTWDGLDKDGKQMPSGKYFVGYQVGDTLVKFSPVLLDGEITTSTDGVGQFRITSDHLPVGEVFDFYLLNGTYDATLRVAPAITLEFEKQSLRAIYSYIPLTKDKITTGAFSF